LKRLAILGASGHAKVVADAAELCGWEQCILFDDAWPAVRQLECWDVCGTTDQLVERRAEFDGAIVAIGNCATRRALHVRLRDAGCSMATIIHPSAVVSRRATVGAGSFVAANAVVGVCVELGEACIINTSASVDHDCWIAEAVHIAPGANVAGGVHIGAMSWIGIGASVKQDIKIGSGVMVGAGAVVVGPVADNSTVVGCPAK
jgi:sugar O-acyltransferase (sialic acid O-acetyltransferase NeuD family)